MEQTRIQPIQNFIFDGINKRLQQCFGCPAWYSDSASSIKDYETVKKNVTFPYIIYELSSLAARDDFYSSHCLARHGVKVVANSTNVESKAKILPVQYEFNASYYTDKNKGESSVMFFMSRWLFARRLGYLKFTINYGVNSYGCSLLLSESLSQPKREQDTSEFSPYKVESSFTVVGFISEPLLLTEGVVETIHTKTSIGKGDQKPAIKVFEWVK